MNRACLPSLCSWAAVLLLAASPAWAQLEIVSSPNAVGSGARALGMGGAFIAVADDATAASWNPGGLTQLERPEFSLVLSQKWFSEDFTSGTHPELNGSFDVDFADFNYISFVYPLKHTIAGRNLVFSLNYQSKFDFDRVLNVRFRDITAGVGTIVDSSSRLDYRQEGQLGALSPAFGIEILDNLSVGAVWNIWDQSLISSNGWSVHRDFHSRTRFNGTIFPGSYSRLQIDEDYDNFSGQNFTLGTLYKPNSRWSIGLKYETKFTADVDYTIKTRSLSSGGLALTRQTRPLQYVYPSALAVGVAYRFPNDKLTLSMDVTRREWDQFVIHDPRNRSLLNRRRSGITGQPMEFAPDIDPVYTVRLGAEYVFVNPKKPKQNYLPSLRGGVFYDPEPSGGRKSTFWGLTQDGDGKPEPFYGFSLGAGLLVMDRVNIDLAYTYRWGRGVRPETFGLAETDADVDQHLLYLSTVIYF